MLLGAVMQACTAPMICDDETRNTIEVSTGTQPTFQWTGPGVSEVHVYRSDPPLDHGDLVWSVHSLADLGPTLWSPLRYGEPGASDDILTVEIPPERLESEASYVVETQVLCHFRRSPFSSMQRKRTFFTVTP
jgi:hypothetical protein